MMYEYVPLILYDKQITLNKIVLANFQTILKMNQQNHIKTFIIVPIQITSFARISIRRKERQEFAPS